MTNQTNPVSVLGEFSLLGRKDSELVTSGVAAELRAIKSDGPLRGRQLKQTIIAQTCLKGKEEATSC